MYQRARHLLKQGDNVVAKKLLVRCLELNSYDAHSWLALAKLEANMGNVDKSRELFSQAMIKCPNNVHMLHAWGHMEQKYGNEVLARDCWSKAMKIEPYNAYICHALSSLELRHRNYDAARAALENVVWHKPTSTICVSLSELERQVGNPEKARSVLEHGLKVCQTDRSKLLLSMAWLEEDFFHNTAEARRLIEEAMDSDVNNVRVYIAKASMELRLKLHDDARQTLLAATALPSDDAQHYTMWGTLEIECGNYAEARRILEEGSAKYSGDQFLLQRWGTLEAKHGCPEKAKELFERSILIKPHAPTFVAWAMLEEEQGLESLHALPDHTPAKPSVASAAPSSLKDSGGDDTEDILKIIVDKHAPGGVLSEQKKKEELASNKFQKARQLFSIGMLVDPQHGPLYHAYGNMELRRGNITGARDVFTRAISVNCSDAASLYHALGLLELKEDVELARRVFHKGIELGLNGNREVDSGVGFLLHSLGVLELDNGRPEEAIKVFLTGISFFPQHSQMLLGLAQANMRSSFYDKAREHFRAAVDADPHHAQAWQCWAIAEKQSGNIELARVLFRQGLKKGPMHGALWQAFAVMEMQQGNFDVARSLFGQSIQRCPAHAQSYQAWACLEVRLGDLHKAKKLVLEGIRQAPAHAALWTAAGLVEERLGDVSNARRIFETALIRFPKHGALFKSLGELEARQGAYLKARDTFAQGLGADPNYIPVYHAAALLEAKLGNIEGLSELHKQAKTRFENQANCRASNANGETRDIIERIRQIEVAAFESSGDVAGDRSFDSVYNGQPNSDDTLLYDMSNQ